MGLIKFTLKPTTVTVKPSSEAVLPKQDENIVPASPSPSAVASPRPGHKKTVSFSSLEVRQYSLVVGDHPCTTIGCPLSLGWEVCDESQVAVDDYEATRCPRRTRAELRLACEERRERLEPFVASQELRKASRQLHRARSCSAKLCERRNASFFQAN